MPPAATPGVVLPQPGLVARRYADVAAREEEAAGDGVGVRVPGDLAACRLDRRECGFPGQHRELPERGEQPALVGTVRMYVDQEQGRPAAVRASVTAATTVGIAPVWSQCQCETKSTSI